MELTVGETLLCREAFDLRLYIVERANPFKRFFSDLRAAKFPKVMELASRVRPTCSFLDPTVACFI